MKPDVVSLDGTLASAEERRDFLNLLALSPSSRLLEIGAEPPDAADESFDALLCIDAIAELRDREQSQRSTVGALRRDLARCGQLADLRPHQERDRHRQRGHRGGGPRAIAGPPLGLS